MGDRATIGSDEISDSLKRQKSALTIRQHVRLNCHPSMIHMRATPVQKAVSDVRGNIGKHNNTAFRDGGDTAGVPRWPTILLCSKRAFR